MPAEAEAPIVALDALCRERDAAAQAHGDLAGFLRAHGVEGDDLEQLTGVGADRLLVYRTLVHNRVREVIRNFMPRAIARLGDQLFEIDFSTYMQERAPRSHYLRDVPREFLTWVTPRWEANLDVPTYLSQLAEHELLDQDVPNSPAGGEPPTGRPLDLARPLRFDGTVRMVEYDWALHELPEPSTDRTEPTQTRTRLMVYRDRETFRPRYLALTAFGGELLSRLQQGQPVQAALQDACAALGEPLDDARLAVAAELFADLGERKVLLGAD